MQESILPEQNDVASRIAERTLADRSAGYSTEIRRLLDAGRQVMQETGLAKRARVADIVAAAGLSNDAFYRHFKSKDELVAAILEDGAERLRSYLAHQMDKESTPENKIRRWVDGILSQAADDEIAAATRAVLWNADGLPDRSSTSVTSALLGTLVEAPFAELGSPSPALDATLAAHAIVGRLSDHLFAQTRPNGADAARITEFFVAAASPGSGAQSGA